MAMEHIMQPTGFSYVGPLGEWYESRHMTQTSRIRIGAGFYAKK